ncbi:NAD(+)/NADH kinase [Tepidiforma sp.]|uniref:NAD(+)/NADH kinase n=1 Tax=Tepidiforma sp. TaxID=2682230 RepID=UPI002ADD559F|nr:NAD(+)/NADH kinase [Tepidiforma sp.]
MEPHILGIIANPASGKDIRRLVAHAAVVTDAAKRGILRRLLSGVAASGPLHVQYLPGPHRLVEEALHGLTPELRAEPLPIDLTDSAHDTRAAACLLRQRGAGAVVVLGGDGTCRAAAVAWPEIPLLPLSTGTNNVFPLACEPTIAGLAAGLVASGRVPLLAAAHQYPSIHVEIDGEPPDLALVDAALVQGQFSGTRAVWKPAELLAALLLRSDPAVTGLAAIGGMLGLPEPAAGALALEFGEPGHTVRVPLAPGLVVPIPVRSHRPIPFGEPIEWYGPGILALDGERERRLLPGQRARLLPCSRGPLVLEPGRILRRAAAAGLFAEASPGANHGH